MDYDEIRAAALLAASRGAVNPGIVIQNARRFAVWIESGHDIGATPVKVPPKDEQATCECGHTKLAHKPDGCVADVIRLGLPALCRCRDHAARNTGLCRDDCAFLDGRGFCTCGGQPELMVKPRADKCPDCPHVRYNHGADGCGFCNCTVAHLDQEER